MIILEGLDWQWGDQNGDDESIGTVYRVKRRGEVYVSWHIATRASKSFYKSSSSLKVFSIVFISVLRRSLAHSI